MITSNIRVLMGEKKKSIRALMRDTGLSSLTIERARGPLIQRCTLLTLLRIASALDCEVKDLFQEMREHRQHAIPPANAKPKLERKRSTEHV